MTNQAELRRLRWSVPAADVSVNEWLDAQSSISQSLRLLIRESIERDGFIDVTFKPVKQLPRRGRPPGDANEPSRSPQGEPVEDDAGSSAQLPEHVQAASVAAPERMQVSEPIESQVASEPVPVSAPVASPAFTDKPTAPASPTRPAPAAADADARVNDAVMDLLA
ncbi:hypothetical protein [Arthrobacter bambusae]|uniref:Uncharacterized protein n=1 Tax=Arthrobacter bambusae TaxID=1338426 RepID=A0AAW8DHH9_9MICC|nr:hypothetical protein [Arthrobacter bambusae]MDP9904719.1 hypothetical protein [Arthrobacter bambusae]MDQ0129535.1 hypothetical protein [Arthrobacter bambusae]MDQ0180852.1 hypothetical protein [Arthrobacter bambusae]